MKWCIASSQQEQLEPPEGQQRASFSSPLASSPSSRSQPLLFPTVFFAYLLAQGHVVLVRFAVKSTHRPRRYHSSYPTALHCLAELRQRETAVQSLGGSNNRTDVPFRLSSIHRL